MIPYWLLFLIAASAALFSAPAAGVNIKTSWTQGWRSMFLLLVLLIGLRHEVGGDWVNYLSHLDMPYWLTWEEALSKGDPAYSLLQWVGAHWGGGIYLINTVCGLFFSYGLVVFCRAQPQPWLALAVAVPYLITVVAMGYSRQGVAIGFAMLGLVALGEQRTLKFFVWIACAAAFHKSAVILVPLAVFAGRKNRFVKIAGVVVAGVMLYVLLLQESVDALYTNYVEAEYQSSGAAIRVAMNALPALLFFRFRSKFELSRDQLAFWTWMSISALLFVVLLVVSPSSTAVDRVALYWIPLQLFVLSRLPAALGSAWKQYVVVYSGAVLFVWLNFATNAFAWVPYQFYPWVLMWQ